MTENPLHLVSLRLDTAGVYRWSRAQRLPAHELDLGYAVHATLKALFQDLAPQPFRVVGTGDRALRVFGYARASARDLEAQARSYSVPEAFNTCRWPELATKPMPASFPEGSRLTFEVRACPVRRIARRGPLERERAEVDAFLAHCWEVGDAPVDREAVYREWISNELAKSGGAQVQSLRVVSWQQADLHRRNHAERRTAHRLRRPEVVVEGELAVQGASAFSALLARGVGRHRAFGFGMLLLRPPRSPC